MGILGRFDTKGSSERIGGAVKLFTLLLAVTVPVSACSSPGSQAATSPSSKSIQSPPKGPQTSATSATSASPAGSPIAVVGSFGVLMTPISAPTYTVSLIGIDGKVVSSAQAGSPTTVTCGGTAAAVLPLPISTSNSRVYYLDTAGVVHFLGPTGDTGRATTVPVGSQRRSTFSVSPNDKRIAVVVNDFTSGGAATRLYVEDLQGGTNHADIFSETGSFGLWPIGWHGSSLVVAKVPTCTQGGGFGCCGPLEFHLIDPATAVRSLTIGGTDCIISGPPTPGGVLCETAAVDGKVFDWNGGLRKQMPIGFQRLIYLSPDGQRLATSDSGTTTLLYETQTLKMAACGWIDDTHVFAGSDGQGQPGVGDTTTGTVAPVAAMGTCAGRIPGGL